MQFKTIAFDPFTFSVKLPLNFLVDLLQSHEVKAIVKGIVEDKFISLHVSRWCLDGGFTP